MKTDPEDLRRRFQALETPELLQLYREGGFTDSAKAILEEILGTRRVAPIGFRELPPPCGHIESSR